MGRAAKFAVVSLWIVGALAGIEFMKKFSREMKPLVLAFVFVAVLETLVQMFEFWFLKLYIFISLLIYSMWCMVKMAWRKFLNLFRERQRSLVDIKEDLCFYWPWLMRPWTPKDAGAWVAFRGLAVLITISLLILLVLFLYTVFMHQATQLASKVQVYKDQVGAIIKNMNSLLKSLPTYFPERWRPFVEKLVEKAKTHFAVDELWPLVAEYVSEAFSSVFNMSADFVMETVFFLLYTVFLLIAPLHIISSSDTPVTESSCWSRWFGWPSRTNSVRPVAEEPLMGPPEEEHAPRLLTRFKSFWFGSSDRTSDSDEKKEEEELQEYLYNIMWNYFMMLILLNAIFASLVFVLLNWLEVDLSMILAAATFFLSFIPELGSIGSMLLPTPFIILTPLASKQDVSRHPSCADCTEGVSKCLCDLPDRVSNLLWAGFWLMTIKLAVHNLLYSYIMGKNRALAGAVNSTAAHEITETHGALVLFAVMFFGNVWGTTGMLISVPAISVMRLSLNLVTVPQARKSRYIIARRQTMSME